MMFMFIKMEIFFRIKYIFNINLEDIFIRLCGN